MYAITSFMQAKKIIWVRASSKKIKIKEKREEKKETWKTSSNGGLCCRYCYWYCGCCGGHANAAVAVAVAAATAVVPVIVVVARFHHAIPTAINLLRGQHSPNQRNNIRDRHNKWKKKQTAKLWTRAHTFENIFISGGSWILFLSHECNRN